jgi:glycosyltransferase involved in cell wall biosynthesis
MIKILVHFNDKSGCTLHRLILPNSFLPTDEFEVTWGFDNNLSKEDNFKLLEDKDILIFHRLLPNGWIEEIKEKFPNLIIVADTDDTWVLYPQHILYENYKKYKVDEKIRKHLQLADYVTTTTDILADRIRLINPNVVVFPNALIPDGQFKPVEKPSNRIRVGLIGGVTHVTDMALLEGITRHLSKDTLDKIQFVLCGFDEAFINIPMPDGTVEKVLMNWNDNPWVKMEKILTDNYSTVSQAYKSELLQYTQSFIERTDEPYKRVWTKDIWTYMQHYDDIDILLVPLLDNDFNRYKSELKFIEASVKKKAVISSDVYPYRLCAIPALMKGGTINPEGNCLLVNNQKGVRGWAKAITKLVNDVNLRDLITENLSKLTQDGYYNLKYQANNRIKFYKQITNGKEE